MNTTTRQVLRALLEELDTDASHPALTMRIRKRFEGYFEPEELRLMLENAYNDERLIELDINSKDVDELYDLVMDGQLLIKCFLDRWDKERDLLQSCKPEAVQATLSQLCLHGHYLGEKSVSQWDGYDLSNYRSLQLRSGRLIKVYGIYDALVSEEDVMNITSPPKRLYDDRAFAQVALDAMAKRHRRDHIDYRIHELYIAP